MTLRQIYTVKNNRLVIQLPDSLSGRKKLLVTLEDTLDEHEEKLLLMAKAAVDPLFLEDLREVNEDFKDVEGE